jgi:hypothetical protein
MYLHLWSSDGVVDVNISYCSAAERVNRLARLT